MPVKEIRELWKITYTKREFHEDDNGETYSHDETKTVYEFSYDDCISTYVSFAEDGYICSYEEVDEKFRKVLFNIDINLNLAITNQQFAILDNDMKQYENLGLVIETLKGVLVNLFISFEEFPFDIEKRCNEIVKDFPRKLKEQGE